MDYSDWTIYAISMRLGFAHFITNPFDIEHQCTPVAMPSTYIDQPLAGISSVSLKYTYQVTRDLLSEWKMSGYKSCSGKLRLRQPRMLMILCDKDSPQRGR
jgi:hypothetical protein